MVVIQLFIFNFEHVKGESLILIQTISTCILNKTKNNFHQQNSVS